MNQHNHSVEDYKSDVFQLKAKCKSVAKHSQMNLRKLFDDTTRHDRCAADISFVECESSLYRARRTLVPNIPPTATDFCEILK